MNYKADNCCEWCRNAIQIRLSRWSTLSQYEVRIQFDNEAQNANFCPICGRNLAI